MSLGKSILSTIHLFTHVFVGFVQEPINTDTSRGARYYQYTDKPRCGLEKIRIAIWFGRIGSLGNLR